MLKRFRFSLLSLLVSVVLAGGFGWLNLLPMITASSRPQPTVVDTHLYGWPFVAYTETVWTEETQLKLNTDVAAEREIMNYILSLPANQWYWPGLTANIAIGLAIVFGGAGVCEYVVRRRAAKVE